MAGEAGGVWREGRGRAGVNGGKAGVRRGEWG